MKLRLGSETALFLRSWIPEEPERLLVVVHGFGEHCGRYEGLASWFAERGFAVYAHDQRGHGQTGGRRGHVERFDDFVDDLRAVVGYAKDEHPQLSLSVVGHSMGGLVTSRMACLGSDEIESYAVSGPLISLASGVSSFRALAGRLLSRVAPRFQLDAGVSAQWLSHDEQVVRDYCDDPLVHGKMSLSLAAGILGAQRQVLSEAAKVAAPMLVLHGTEDRLCAPEGSEKFFSGLAAEVARVSELALLPGLYHEIFNEVGHEEVFERLLVWLRRADRALS